MSKRRKGGKTAGRRRGAARVGERKAPRTYRLVASKIAEARRILDAPSDTAAIEMALDVVAFRHELASGLEAMRGVRITPFEE